MSTQFNRFRRFSLNSTITAICFFFLAHYTMTAQSEIGNDAEATNIAGKQRMLTQRMLMNYALIGQKISYQSPQKDQARVIQLFESQLNAITQYKQDPNLSKASDSVKSQWQQVKPKLLQSPTKAAALSVKKELDELLRRSHQLTQLLAGSNKNRLGTEINTSGRQRMLSQKMAGLYMLKSWQLDTFEFSDEYKQVLNEFRQNQKALKSSSATTPEIVAQLNKADKAFLWFHLSEKAKTKTPIPSLILRSSNNILAAMDQATLLYTKK